MIIINRIQQLLIYPVCLFVLALAFANQALADELPDPVVDHSNPAQYDAGQTDKPPMDPTLEFFISLSSCIPGSYKERNILSDEYGEVYLNQQILGKDDDDGMCSAVLSTPDRRIIECQFTPQDLARFNDQHFLAGIIMNTTEAPSQASINADTLWAEIKNQRCEFIQDE